MKNLKSPHFKTYIGCIPEPNIENFFTGRIWSRHDTPFPQEKINTYITHNFLTTSPAVTTTPKLMCNRCLNTAPHQFIAFHCAKCQKICHYCRHCITMGRMCSCDDLITWSGPSYSVKRAIPQFTWEGTLTLQQQKAANELTESLLQNRHHLINAV